MPKLASVINVLSHAWSSHSSEGTAQASLDDDNAWDDDFQTPHTPVHCVVWREDDGHGELVDGRMESSRGRPGWQTGYQVDIGEEEEEEQEEEEKHKEREEWEEVGPELPFTDAELEQGEEEGEPEPSRGQ